VIVQIYVYSWCCCWTLCQCSATCCFSVSSSSSSSASSASNCGPDCCAIAASSISRRTSPPPGRFDALTDPLKLQSNGPLYSNTVIGTRAVDGWVVTCGTAKRGLGAAASQAPPCYTTCNSPPINGQCTNFIFIIRCGTIIGNVHYNEIPLEQKPISMQSVGFGLGFELGLV